jgi:CRP-like cAMP-binding protein
MAESSERESNNRLLAALPSEDYARLSPHLSRVSLDAERILHEMNQPVEHIYFPETMLVSLLNMLSDGSAIEVGVLGKEGLTGIFVLLGSDRARTRAMVQISGTAMRIRTVVLKEEFERGGQLQTLLLRYMSALMAQMAQTAACNCLHTVDQRLARWLLMARMRVDSDELPLTQEFIAQMLGTRRAGVSEAASTLQDAGLIRYARGHITILDLRGLEEASCECYRVVKNEFENIYTADSGGE